MASVERSPALMLASLPEAERLKILQSLNERQAEELLHDWRFWARPNQLAPAEPWTIWLVLAGRGFGKTRTGGEWIRERTKVAPRSTIVGPTGAAVRDIMVEGESGILAVCSRADRPHYEPSKRRLNWPNGAITMTYSADEPDRIRGLQHESVWADEIAAWNFPEAWDMLLLGLRLGTDPKAVVTTTPKPKRVVRELLENPACRVTTGSTYENRANLAPPFFQTIVAKYEGTRIGQQELHAKVLDEAPGALWKRVMLDEHRVQTHPELARVVVAVDPAVTATEDSDETGIVVAARGVDDHGYVLEDASCRLSPDGWAQRVCTAYRAHMADRVVGEANQGGDMVEVIIRSKDPHISYAKVHASRGKQTRAEPVAALYEQGRIHHVGLFADLEDQLATWEPGIGEASPDRLDALVWALTELFLDGVEKPDVW